MHVYIKILEYSFFADVRRLLNELVSIKEIVAWGVVCFYKHA